MLVRVRERTHGLGLPISGARLRIPVGTMGITIRPQASPASSLVVPSSSPTNNPLPGSIVGYTVDGSALYATPAYEITSPPITGYSADGSPIYSSTIPASSLSTGSAGSSLSTLLTDEAISGIPNWLLGLGAALAVMALRRKR
jgi:hypothetical protein